MARPGEDLAQQTIPLLVRWMLVFEDPDADRLYLGRALPQKWVASGKPIAVDQAPTRWGRVDYRLEPRGDNELIATIALPDNGEAPKELQTSFRVPVGQSLTGLSVNSRPVTPAGRRNDAAVFDTAGVRRFTVVATLG